MPKGKEFKKKTGFFSCRLHLCDSSSMWNNINRLNWWLFSTKESNNSSLCARWLNNSKYIHIYIVCLNWVFNLLKVDTLSPEFIQISLWGQQIFREAIWKTQNWIHPFFFLLNFYKAFGIQIWVFFVICSSKMQFKELFWWRWEGV